MFVAAQTVTTDGDDGRLLRARRHVVFRAYAVDGKTHKVLAAKDVKYFYVTIPNQPNVKLTYDPKAPGAIGRPAVDRHVDGAVRLRDGHRRLQGAGQDERASRKGQFVQLPVASSS